MSGSRPEPAATPVYALCLMAAVVLSAFAGFLLGIPALRGGRTGSAIPEGDRTIEGSEPTIGLN